MYSGTLLNEIPTEKMISQYIFQVFISGTFTEWKTIPMVKSHGDFVTIIDLPEGEHQYKYFVDGEWRHDPTVVIPFIMILLIGLQILLSSKQLSWTTFSFLKFSQNYELTFIMQGPFILDTSTHWYLLNLPLDLAPPFIEDTTLLPSFKILSKSKSVLNINSPRHNVYRFFTCVMNSDVCNITPKSVVYV